MLIHNNSTNLRKISKNIDDMMSQYSCINNRCNFSRFMILSYKMSDFKYISSIKPKFTTSADSMYYESTEYIFKNDSFSDIVRWYNEFGGKI